MKSTSPTCRPVALVIDDEPSMRELLSTVLEEEGYVVLTAKDGQDCLEHLEHCPPDIVILDLHMPNMKGDELVGHLRSRQATRDVPIVVISGSPSLCDEHPLYEQVQAFLAKPFDLDRLVRLVNELSLEAEVI